MKLRDILATSQEASLGAVNSKLDSIRAEFHPVADGVGESRCAVWLSCTSWFIFLTKQICHFITNYVINNFNYLVILFKYLVTVL
jgi:hypothetical protein